MTYRPKDDDETDSEAEPGKDNAAPRVYFRPVAVFDISQTDPVDGQADAVPAATPAVTGDAPEGLWDALTAYAAQRGYTTERGDCGHADGYTDPTTRTVRISGTEQDAAAVLTLIHEVAHIACGHADADHAEYRRHRGRMETEAESVAYIVATAHDMDAPTASVHYVAGWAGRTPEEVTATLKAAGKTVIETARTLLTALDADQPDQDDQPQH